MLAVLCVCCILGAKFAGSDNLAAFSLVSIMCLRVHNAPVHAQRHTYICVYFTCMSIDARRKIHVQPCIHAYIQEYMYVYVCCLCVCACVYVDALCVCVCACVCVCECTFVFFLHNRHVSTWIHAYMHHLCVCVCVCAFVFFSHNRHVSTLSIACMSTYACSYRTITVESYKDTHAPTHKIAHMHMHKHAHMRTDASTHE